MRLSRRSTLARDPRSVVVRTAIVSLEAHDVFSRWRLRRGPAHCAAMAFSGSNPDGRPPLDRRPGRLPYIVSVKGNLIWSCRVYSQPSDTRLVLRASADGHVWASIGAADNSLPGSTERENPRRKKREDRSRS
jgi:hypothetical protein